MNRARAWLMVFMMAFALCACTPGAPAAQSSNNQQAAGLLVGMSIIKYGQMSSSFGMVGGFNPGVVVVAHGTTIQFHNEDSFDHTASSVAGASFPGGSPIPTSALTQSGSDVAQTAWSSGNLVGGAFSQVFSTSKTGTYLFGCFYHYANGMRGVILVQ